MDSRVDALAPQIAFNNLQSLLAPYDGAVRRRMRCCFY
jgi:hypothetical protein